MPSAPQISRDPEAAAPLDPRIRAVLSRYWGFDTLRPLQREAIDAAIAGRESVVILPTGGGKSLCFQVPPLITERLCVVVSPLIALMKDQIDGLTLAGYPAGALYSGVSPEKASEIRRRVSIGEIKLLLVAPERLLGESFLAFLVRANVGSFAIDEAHCISQWGHDFRPEYRRLAELREVFPGVPMHAYTATATPRVRDDIVAQLGLRNAAILTGCFDRPNLTYRILPRINTDSQVLEVLDRHKNEAAIVYCISRKETERLAAVLRHAKIKAAAYHAGMDSATRHDIQEDFANERTDVVVATVAFGMGIDRSNVRCVIHASMPKSVEHYQQETGRAGRDGLPSECVMLYSAADAVRWKQLMERSAQEAETPPEPEAIAAQLELIAHSQQLCTSARCRHAALSEYFGQTYTPPAGPIAARGCGACDVCLGELEAVPNSTTIAQKIVSCVARLSLGTMADDRGPSGFGAAYIADVLRGSRAEKIRQRGHEKLSTFGLLAQVGKPELSSMINQLVDAGVLARAGAEYPIIVPGPGARAVLKGESAPALFRAKNLGTVAGEAGAEAPLAGAERELFDALRALRRTIAEELGVPPYVVFADTTLEELSRVRPGSLAAFAHVRGVGQAKLTQFGERFVEAITVFCSKHDLQLDAITGSRPRPRLARKSRDLGASGSASDPERPLASLGESHQQAFKMFERGASIVEVAAAIQRSPGTAAGYLTEFILRSKPVRVSPWVSDAKYAKVAAAAERVGGSRLRPIYEALGGTDKGFGEANYDEIRIVVNHRAAMAQRASRQ